MIWRGAAIVAVLAIVAALFVALLVLTGGLPRPVSYEGYGAAAGSWAVFLLVGAGTAAVSRIAVRAATSPVAAPVVAGSIAITVLAILVKIGAFAL